jgi:hypothetical protein
MFMCLLNPYHGHTVSTNVILQYVLMFSRVMVFFLFSFLVVLGFEFRALHLLGRRFTT